MPQTHPEEKSIGKILKEARSIKNISIEEASRSTRIQPSIIRSLENDEAKTLGAVYARSFLKLYAEYLDLDKNELLKRFQESMGSEEVSRSRRIKFPGEKPLAKGFILSVVLFKAFKKVFTKNNFKFFAVFMALIVVVALIQFRARHRALSGDVEVKPKKAVVQAEKPKAKPKAAETPKTVVAPQVSGPQTPEKIALVVRAKEKTWLQVKIDGKVVFQSILARGAAASWQANEKIELWLGNAGAVELELNGKLMKKIGRPGRPLKNVVITRAGLSF